MGSCGSSHTLARKEGQWIVIDQWDFWNDQLGAAGHEHRAELVRIATKLDICDEILGRREVDGRELPVLQFSGPLRSGDCMDLAEELTVLYPDLLIELWWGTLSVVEGWCVAYDEALVFGDNYSFP
jgi:hypothetical protein